MHRTHRRGERRHATGYRQMKRHGMIPPNQA